MTNINNKKFLLIYTIAYVNNRKIVEFDLYIFPISKTFVNCGMLSAENDLEERMQILD